MMNRKHILFEEEEEGLAWVATYSLGYSEYDDLEESEIEEIIFTAIDFDQAVKYAQQYLRKMQLEEETADSWKNAEILAVELH